jgi:hypothetical protein
MKPICLLTKKWNEIVVLTCLCQLQINKIWWNWFRIDRRIGMSSIVATVATTSMVDTTLRRSLNRGTSLNKRCCSETTFNKCLCSETTNHWQVHRAIEASAFTRPLTFVISTLITWSGFGIDIRDEMSTKRPSASLSCTSRQQSTSTEPLEDK